MIHLFLDLFGEDDNTMNQHCHKQTRFLSLFLLNLQDNFVK